MLWWFYYYSVNKHQFVIISVMVALNSPKREKPASKLSRFLYFQNRKYVYYFPKFGSVILESLLYLENGKQVGWYWGLERVEWWM